MIFCIDSNIFIWGLKKRCDPEDEHLMKRAVYFIGWAAENKHQIMIPTVVLGEILASEPLERHPVIMELTKGCIFVDFDQRAAMRYAQLFMNKIEELKEKSKKLGVDRQKMKIDHLIIACALVNGANCIYSHDNGVKSFGQKYIEIKGLPDMPPPVLTQKSMFEIPMQRGIVVKGEDEDEY